MGYASVNSELRAGDRDPCILLGNIYYFWQLSLWPEVPRIVDGMPIFCYNILI